MDKHGTDWQRQSQEWETIARWHIAECERLRNERSPYPKLEQSQMIEIESNGCATVKPRMDRDDGVFIRWRDVQVMDRSLYRRGLGLGLVVSATQSGKGLADDCYSELEAVRARWKECKAQLAEIREWTHLPDGSRLTVEVGKREAAEAQAYELSKQLRASALEHEQDQVVMTDLCRQRDAQFAKAEALALVVEQVLALAEKWKAEATSECLTSTQQAYLAALSKCLFNVLSPVPPERTP